MPENASVIPPTGAARLEALLFEIVEQRFALATAHVIELSRACAVQSLPMAPEMIIGAVNLRGEVVPVLDVRRRLGLPETAIDPSDCFVFVRAGARRLALRVDRLLGIEALQVTPIAEAPNLPERLAFVSGVAAVADGVIFIYDLEQFLSSTEGAALDRALSLTLGGGP